MVNFQIIEALRQIWVLIGFRVLHRFEGPCWDEAIPAASKIALTTVHQ